MDDVPFFPSLFRAIAARGSLYSYRRARAREQTISSTQQTDGSVYTFPCSGGEEKKFLDSRRELGSIFAALFALS